MSDSTELVEVSVEPMSLTLGIPEALSLKPLLYGLENLGVNIIRDIPAKIALDFSRRISPLDEGCAFLSPIDYARHGSEYLIVPNVGVSSSVPTGTVQLFVKSTVSNIETVAVDIRVTSEIILARIILQEKYRNIATSQHRPAKCNSSPCFRISTPCSQKRMLR